MERSPDAVLIECGHGGLCTVCAGHLWREDPTRRRCPLCRQFFAGVVQITGRGADGSVSFRPLLLGSPRCPPGFRFRSQLVRFPHAPSGEGRDTRGPKRIGRAALRGPSSRGARDAPSVGSRRSCYMHAFLLVH